MRSRPQFNRRAISYEAAGPLSRLAIFCLAAGATIYAVLWVIGVALSIGVLALVFGGGVVTGIALVNRGTSA